MEAGTSREGIERTRGRSGDLCNPLECKEEREGEVWALGRGCRWRACPM